MQELIAIHNAFKRAYFDHGTGFFSVQSGEEHHRGTGYGVLVGTPALINTDDGRGHSLEGLQDFVGKHRNEFSEATPEPHFLVVAGTDGFILAGAITVENLYDAAVRQARQRGVGRVWDFAQGREIVLEQPSLAAIEFLLDVNPWDTDYIRSHI